MFASQARDLSPIELQQSGNISSRSAAKAYRVNGVDISIKEKNKSKNRRIFSPTLALFCCSVDLGCCPTAFVLANAVPVLNHNERNSIFPIRTTRIGGDAFLFAVF